MSRPMPGGALCQAEIAPGADDQRNRGGLRFLLSDLALRDQMAESGRSRARLVTGGTGEMLLRPEPHKFAAFHICAGPKRPAYC